jgi:membrane-bound metal-dependent hydrolase YbcI (DUF457 family)
MYPLGHLGIGTWILPARIRDSLRWPWFAFGCLLPDLLDKPIFVVARIVRHAGPISLAALHTSRLFGHSLFFLGMLVLVTAAFPRAKWARAVTWGVATHLVLDLIPDLISGSRLQWPTWLLWPIFRWHFPFDTQRIVVAGFDFEGLVYLLGEAVGAALLAMHYARRRRAGAFR